MNSVRWLITVFVATDDTNLLHAFSAIKYTEIHYNVAITIP